MRKQFYSLLLMLVVALPSAANAQLIHGDVNDDHEVNIADVNAVIDAVIDNVHNTAADINSDGEVTVADVNALIDIILGSYEIPEEHEWVDLGLPSGTLWATCNVGANSPEEYGDYFAWGEIAPKDYYDWSTYKWCDNSGYLLTKYCTDSFYGTVDNKTDLDPEDDAAWMNWGPMWRMPTFDQIVELQENCSSQWMTLNGINGSLVTGPNGNTIFLPATGAINGSSAYNTGIVGEYWSRSLLVAYNPDGPIYAFNIQLSYSGVSSNHMFRNDGYSVRPVRTSLNDVYVEQQRLDLGIVLKGEASTGELNIINSTDEAITLTVTTGAPFSLKQQDGSALPRMTVEVSGGSYARVTVMFTATDPGEFYGNVTIQHPALEGGQSVIPVHVRAYADPEQDYVDLGLPSGTLWATRNIGANTPEECGDYFAWGETEPKEEYYMSNYKWYDYDNELYTKYCTDSEYGMVDNKTELDHEDDAAWVNLGPSWRMPSREQQNELMEKCSWDWITKNGMKGYLVTGPNGNTIFLPAAGEASCLNADGYYWSRTLGPSSDPSKASCLSFNSLWVLPDRGRRSEGYPVRAVRMSLEHFYIEQQSLDFVASVGDTCTSLLTIVNCTNFPLTLMGSVDEPFYFNWGGGLVTSGTFDVYDKFYVMLAISFIATTPGQYNSKVTFRSALDGTVIEVPISAYVFPDVDPQQDAVDLGLPSGTLWATCNVGASSPEESGDAFAWGETEPVGEYDWNNPWGNYKWCNGSESTLTKYCTDSHYGTVDNLTVLEPEDDAAWVNWGPKWRMPSNEQFTELEEYCTWKRVTKNSVEGRLVTGLNGNSIFLPASDQHAYWSRQLNPSVTFYAFGRDFDSERLQWLLMWAPRIDGCYVRAVSVP